MHKHVLAGLAGVAALGAALTGTFAGAHGTGAHKTIKAISGGGRTPVVVELFTSEGCSDCPPADAVAARLKASQPVPGADILVLGQHVDYWNNSRWADRFSQHQFSTRQQDYAGQLGIRDAPYTPEVIVDGHTDVLGSDQGGIERAVAADARAPKAEVSLTRDGDGVKVHVGHFPDSATGEASDVILAVTEDGLRSHVGGGENAGRSLEHSAVVREMRVVGTVTASPAATYAATVPVALAPGWDRARTQAVVFVQARRTRRILGAASVAL